MRNDHKKIHAAASASFCVRFSTPLLLCCGLLGGMGALGAGVAHADSGSDRGDGGDQRSQRRDDSHPSLREAARPQAQQQQQQQQQPQRQAEQPRQAEQRQADPRQLDPRSYEARAEEQRRAMQEAARNAEMNRRAGRLTPDERRDLRRQINEVGQDIYAAPPRH